jgi:hypothetical protein
MVLKEFYKTRDDGVKLYRTYSDKSLMIQKVGTEEVYDEAIDVDFLFFEYIETTIPIEKESEDI